MASDISCLAGGDCAVSVISFVDTDSSNFSGNFNCPFVVDLSDFSPDFVTLTPLEDLGAFGLFS